MDREGERERGGGGEFTAPLSTWCPLKKNALVFFYSLSVLRILRIFYLAKNFDTMKARMREEEGGR